MSSNSEITRNGLWSNTVALVQFAVLWEGGQKKSMSTRAGQYVTLRELRADRIRKLITSFIS